jgi:hypothetical protein
LRAKKGSPGEKVWGNEPSHSQGSFHLGSWTAKCSKNDYKDQNPMDWGVLYIIEKLLKCKCLKWARMTHLDIWNSNYGQKKGWKSNWQFDSRPLKVRESTWFPCMQVECDILLKRSRWGLQLSFKPHFNQRSAHKIMGPQNHKSPNFGNFRNPGTRCHLDVGLVQRHKVYCKAKVMTSPKSKPWWILWIQVACDLS